MIKNNWTGCRRKLIWINSNAVQKGKKQKCSLDDIAFLTISYLFNLFCLVFVTAGGYYGY